MRPRRFDREVDGIVLLDKSPGLSSNAALQRARQVFRALKAGHAGSLDPMATGMLPVCFGQATKVCSLLLDSRKTYEFTVRLGERTDTGDAEGTPIDVQAVPPLLLPDIEAALRKRVGRQMQIPPMYSALKHRGERLYELARRGEQVERAPRPVEIVALALIACALPDVTIRVECSKGTYVRTLAEDLAGDLGTVGHLVALRRLSVEPFAGRSMHTLEEMTAQAELGGQQLGALLLPPDVALTHLPQVALDVAGEHALLHGQSPAVFQPMQADIQPTDAGARGTVAAVARDRTVRVYGPGGRFLGVGELDRDGRVQPRRLLVKSAMAL